MTPPEPWLRGPVPGVPAELQPVAHALLGAREELEALIPSITAAELRASPGGAATLAFHLLHLAGSLDRLFTYARGEALTPRQRERLAEERAGAPTGDREALARVAIQALDAALEQLRKTPPESLGEVREVGRARLPSTVRGLLFHAAEHTARHVGQVATTLKVLRGG